MSLNEECFKEIQDVQSEIYQTYKHSEENLIRINEISQEKYKENFELFTKHTKELQLLKQNLEDVFIRIRKIKNSLKTKYPNEYQEAEKMFPEIEID
ncbi:hypothetical protein BCR32DRAFT_291864 [Anaeromyces robustus]|uniref:KxDL domain-containing protein n=1 Tax=Anaeromyces robustus TaxID=1754192 RepID=A0A1Y1XCY7_9FUNG|nr:hypothetical protein BCR32DRAFT_291864 [Anaeromyces robustus]|eukprot:ORX83608.1 hypothetical protein BCR32DRAFT_291864 [Anaeromyces robustus]